MQFRNIAIIAHVDHGKTTLVDGLLRQCRVFNEHEQVQDRVMDSMDLERERGITITSKNTAVEYGGFKINIVDTPGHSDFSGEVERVLSMVDGVVLLVDASEGPLPGTRFVLRKAMAAGLKVLVLLNKIDRPDARPPEVLSAVYDLFIDLGADDAQLEFPVLYAVAKQGRAHVELGDDSKDLRPLLDAILQHMPAPKTPAPDAPPQLLVTNLDYDPYVGRLALGRLVGAPLKKGAAVVWFGADETKNTRLPYLYSWRGLKRYEVDEAEPGDIVAVAGVEGITVGDTVSAGPDAFALPRLKVDEPTIGMTFTINTSPLSGREGKYVTGRQLKERLEREMISNVSLRLEELDRSEVFRVYGRGELQLAILIEQMRREGFELSVSRPEVLKKTIDGKLLEPWEKCTFDVPDESVGTITQMLAARKGQLLDLVSDGSGRSRLTYHVPSRGLIGVRGEMLTATRGLGEQVSEFDGWHDDAGFIMARQHGTLVADRHGKTTTYALFALQPRGVMFVGVGEEIYEGMVVGEHSRDNDLNVHACREKQLNNIRTTAADEKQILTPPRQITLEYALEFIDDDEWVEITPKNIRIRKRILEGNKRSIVRGERRED